MAYSPSSLAGKYSRYPASSPSTSSTIPNRSSSLASISALGGPARDAAYIAQQKASHGRAFAVQKAYAADGTATPLRKAAASIASVFASHIELLKAI